MGVRLTVLHREHEEVRYVTSPQAVFQEKSRKADHALRGPHQEHENSVCVKTLERFVAKRH